MLPGFLSLLLCYTGDGVVKQRDTWNCGILAYRWIEQKVCNNVITYTSLDVEYMRELLQVELLRGKPVRLIPPDDEPSLRLVGDVKSSLQRCTIRLSQSVASAQWQLCQPPDGSICSETDCPQVTYSA